MLVKDCELIVSYYMWDQDHYRVFCYPKGKDDFDSVGCFETEAEAEALRQRMLSAGGLVSAYKKRSDYSWLKS